jgi:prepilin-type N-terminal cleavage/methylation domain-containing protein
LKLNFDTKRYTNSKKGFTLIELVIAMVITVLLVGIVTGILAFSTDLFGNVLKSTDSKNIGDEIMKWTKDRIQSSYEVAVSEVDIGTESEELILTSGSIVNPDTTSAGIIMIGAAHETSGHDNPKTSNQGYLYFKRADDAAAAVPINVFSESYYRGNTISLTVHVLDKDTMKLYLVVYNSDGQQVYKTSSSVTLLEASTGVSGSAIQSNQSGGDIPNSNQSLVMYYT